jgi:hypothetical protein
MEALLYRRKTGSIYLIWLAADHTLMCTKGYLQIDAQDLDSPLDHKEGTRSVGPDPMDHHSMVYFQMTPGIGSYFIVPLSAPL